MEKRKENFIEGSREEEKRVSLLTINGEKYRLIYSKVYGHSVIKDILKVEISTNFKILLPQIKEIIENKCFSRVHLYVRYEEFLRLETFVDEIDDKLMFEGYEVNFVFNPKEYSVDEFILMYEIIKIESIVK